LSIVNITFRDNHTPLRSSSLSFSCKGSKEGGSYLPHQLIGRISVSIGVNGKIKSEDMASLLKFIIIIFLIRAIVNHVVLSSY
jgi:hypothetical protein